jgi:hypothetical protein
MFNQSHKSKVKETLQSNIAVNKTKTTTNLKEMEIVVPKQRKARY